MATPTTFLQLSPEFGGTKFGPFPGLEIRLGSDPHNSDIVLPEALGVSPQHVRVIRQNDGSFIVAPTERTATVFLWRAGGRAPKQITTPTAVAAGDGFSLVTQEGPRFYILLEQPSKAASQDAVAPTKDDKPGVGEGIFAEMKRIGLAKVFTTRLGSMFQTGWMMVKSGAIFSPRYIVMGMMMIVPMMMAGGAGCAAISFRASAASKQTQITELQSDLDVCQGGSEGEDPTVASLTQSLLGDKAWMESLEADPDFNQRYQKQLRSVFERKDKFSWVWKRKKSEMADLYKRLEGDLGPSLAVVFAYTAAHAGFVPDREWGLIQRNSERQRTCGRGPALISYRQASNLGLAAQPDALVPGSIAESDDVDAKAAKLRETLGGDEREFKNEEIQAEGAGLQGGFQCLYLEGEDERTDPKAIASALAKKLGPSAKGLPSEGDDGWITTRLARFYISDFLFGADEVDLSKGIASLALEEVGPDQKEYVLDSAAETMAKAVAIPCLAILDADTTEHLGTTPGKMQCAMLWFLSGGEI